MASGGDGGTASGGNMINLVGGAGGISSASSVTLSISGGGSGLALGTSCGEGGSTPLGRGGYLQYDSVGGFPSMAPFNASGTGYGSGASGSMGTVAHATGADGQDGVCIITEYIG